MPKSEIVSEEVLIGLSMLSQLFGADFDRDLALTTQNLYRGQEAELLKAVVSAATLCLQRYALDTDIPELDVIANVRSKILSGETLLG